MHVISLPCQLSQTGTDSMVGNDPWLFMAGCWEEGRAGGRSFFHTGFLFHIWKQKSRWYPWKRLVVVNRHVDVGSNTSYNALMSY